MLYPKITNLVEQFLHEKEQIEPERQFLLKQFASYLNIQITSGAPVSLNFICTHNSRRSHLAQLWSAVAINYFQIKGIQTYSGGTEVTALNPRIITALNHLGFQITQSGTDNPHYQIAFGKGQEVTAYSKLYDDAENPQKDFVAIMTCDHADENCPLIPGVAWRIALTYQDPKVADGTSEEARVYQQRALQIGREMVYVFSLLG